MEKCTGMEIEEANPNGKILQWWDKYAKVVTPYTASDSLELNLEVGDIITILGKVDENVWKGELNGQVGLFKVGDT